jgi:hypothetical protein
VTRVTGLFFDGAHATMANATFVARASPNLSALAALQAFFKEFGDEQ